jgi:hypothetical protein
MLSFRSSRYIVTHVCEKFRMSAIRICSLARRVNLEIIPGGKSSKDSAFGYLRKQLVS